MIASPNRLQPGPMFDLSAAYKIGHVIFDVDNTLVGDNSPNAPTEELLQGIADGVARGIGFSVMSARGIGKLKD